MEKVYAIAYRSPQGRIKVMSNTYETREDAELTLKNIVGWCKIIEIDVK